MSTRMAKRFNRRAASAESRSEQILESLPIRTGQRIADIGSGGGFFSFAFARRVGPSGTIYAVDKNESLLHFVEQESIRNKLHNLETVLLQNGDLPLPENAIDLIFLRNVFHHIDDPNSYLNALKRILKPGGKIAIIDYKEKNGFNFHSLFGHFVPEEKILQSMQQAGFERLASFSFLPAKSFNLFQLPAVS